MYPLNPVGLEPPGLSGSASSHLRRALGQKPVPPIPYPSKSKGWPAQLARYMASPHEAFRHIVDEFCTLALNQFSGLFGPGNSLT